MDGVIILEHAMSFEAQQSQQEEIHPSQSPPSYEKGTQYCFSCVQINHTCPIVVTYLSFC